MSTHEPIRPPVTIKTLRKMASSGEPFAALTCYDATTAKWLQRAGIHVLLVGDTAAEVVLGYSRTIDMPLDVLVALTAGVKRGAPETVVMADMPFLSYHGSEDEAIRNAGRFLTQGLADIVKLEADESFAPLVQKIARAGIPVCAHVGTRPQQVALTGGYTAAGKTPKQAAQIVADAVALERAGAVMLLIEAVPDQVTEDVLKATTVPVIGIGAGPAPHGQVLVLQDLLGLTDRQPPFAHPIAQLGTSIQTAAQKYVQMVAERQIGSRTPQMGTTSPKLSTEPRPATN
ncbi:MAG: 3-methyl-2-oxobutanoate hydroxymethyltransferase [Phycisphaerales bacterium]|nr:3-methyl-2-oxobutanoate hydroxymethyltransferase [Planctomycetota bacterium]